MSNYTVDFSRMGNKPGSLKNISDKIMELRGEIEASAEKVNEMSPSLRLAGRILEQLLQQMQREQDGLRSCGDMLKQCIELYEKAEKSILGMQESQAGFGDKQGWQESAAKEQFEKISLMSKTLRQLEKLSGGESATETSEQAGDPVDMATGNYMLKDCDLSIHAGADFSLFRFYNSAIPAKGVLSKGWSHSFEIYLVFDDNNIIAHMGDGTLEKFAPVQGKAVEVRDAESGVRKVKDSSLAADVLAGLSNAGEDSDADADNEIEYRSRFGSYDRIFKSREGYRYVRVNRGEYRFNPAGQAVRYQDRSGCMQQFSYQDGLLDAVTDSQGDSIRFTYDRDRRLSCAEDHTGRKVQYEYTDGLLSRVTGPDGEHVSYTYDQSGFLRQIFDARGVCILENYCDDIGRILSQSMADGTSVKLEYEKNLIRLIDRDGETSLYHTDKKHRITRVQYPSGEVSYAYDAGNRCISFTDPNGSVFRRSYDERGLLTKSWDPDGNEADYQYDACGRIASITAPDQGTTTSSYDAEGNLTRYEDADGNVTEIVYQDGRVSTVRQPDGSRVHFQYDLYGRLSEKHLDDQPGYVYEYDRLGQLSAKTDPEGNRTAYQYTKTGQISSIINAEGRERRYVYRHRFLESVTDFDGYSVRWTYTPAGRVETFTDKEERTTRYVYGCWNDPVAVIYPDGFSEKREYDQMGRPVRILGRGGEIRYTYDAAGNCTVRSENGTEKRYQYDRMGRPVRIRFADGGEDQVRYDAAGRVKRHLRRDGAVFSYEYLPGGALKKVTAPGGIVYENTYSSLGKVTETRCNGIPVRTYTYYPGGMLRSAAGQNGLAEQYAYDAGGKRVSRVFPDGYRMQYGYDAMGRMTSAEDSTGRLWTMQYDAGGHLAARSVPSGAETRFTWTPDGRMYSVTDPEGHSYVYGYDAKGQLETLADGDDTDTPLITWQTDSAGNILQRTDGLGHAAHYLYGLDGKLLEKTDADGRRTAYTRDCAGRVAKAEFADGLQAVYSYDAIGRVAGLTDWTGTSCFSYDAWGNLLSAEDAAGRKVSYDRDALRRITVIRYPDGSGAVYHYNNLGQLSEVTGQGHRVALRYDEAGRISEKITDDRLKETFSYVPGGQLSCMVQELDGTVKNQTKYTWDSNGNLSVKEVFDGEKTDHITYHYDLLDRLTEVIKNGVSEETFTYDRAGNCIMYRTKDQLIRRNYDILNRKTEEKVYAQEDDCVLERTYFYDDSGNRTVCVERIPDGDEETKQTFDIDARGRVATVQDESGSRAEYVTNAFGALTGMKHSELGQTPDVRDLVPDYTISGWPVLAEVSATKGTERSFLRAGRMVVGDRFRNTKGEGCEEKTGVYRTDERGSILGYYTPEGSEEYGYSTFGVMQKDGRKIRQPFGYAGLYRSPVADLLLTPARVYDPADGAFLSEDRDAFIRTDDPVTINLYRYCRNNPVLWVDPQGTDCYIFYLPDWENEAKNDQRQLAKKYGYDKSQVHLIPITSNDDFTNGWNAMGTENGQTVDIDTVVIDTHANPNVLGDNNNFTYTTPDVQNLQDKEMENLILLGCNAGHEDYNDNMADTFAGKTEGAPVMASDGTVYSGHTFFNLTKRSYSSKGDDTFTKLRGDRSDRDNAGWVIYQEENGQVTTTEVNDEKMNVSDMVDTMRDHQAKQTSC